MKIAFIKDNKVVKCYAAGALYKIAKANFRKDWQVIMDCSDSVMKGWDYNPETEQLTAP